jgi:CRISPR-associated endonuclease Cas1
MLLWLAQRLVPGRPTADAPPAEPALRPEPRLPLHILVEDAELRIEDGLLGIEAGGESRTLRLDEISLVALHGAAMISTPCLATLADAAIPVVFLSRSGYYRGQLVDLSVNHAATRRAQYLAAADPARCLAFARAIVVAKIAGAHRQLRRRLGARHSATRILDRERRRAAHARSLDSLRGTEGAAAAAWFASWPGLISRDDPTFLFDGRSRRPPRDAVNALLSYLYAVLAGTTATAALAVGLDPNVGFLHAERAGRPALALDLVEPLRTAIVDAAVLAALNNGEFGVADFVTGEDGGVSLSESGRRAALSLVERRLSTPLAYAGTEMTWRAAISQHALLIARALRNGAAPPPAPLGA